MGKVWRELPSQQTAGPVFSDHSDTAMPLVLGTTCSLGQQLRQTDPEQHPRKGLREGMGWQPLSQAPVLGLSHLDWHQLSLLGAGTLLSHPCSIAGAGTSQTLP